MTFNNLVSEFQSYANSHKMIKYFGVGHAYDLASSAQPLYPVMWVYPQNSTVNETVCNLTFAITFGDLVLNDKSNLYEVWSDMLLLTQHFTTYLYEEHPELIIELPVRIEPFEEFTDENITGWTMYVTVQLHNPITPCDIPN